MLGGEGAHQGEDSESNGEGQANSSSALANHPARQTQSTLLPLL